MPKKHIVFQKCVFFVQVSSSLKKTKKHLQVWVDNSRIWSPRFPVPKAKPFTENATPRVVHRQLACHIWTTFKWTGTKKAQIVVQCRERKTLVSISLCKVSHMEEHVNKTPANHDVYLFFLSIWCFFRVFQTVPSMENVQGAVSSRSPALAGNSLPMEPSWAKNRSPFRVRCNFWKTFCVRNLVT